MPSTLYCINYYKKNWKKYKFLEILIWKISPLTRSLQKRKSHIILKIFEKNNFNPSQNCFYKFNKEWKWITFVKELWIITWLLHYLSDLQFSIINYEINNFLILKYLGSAFFFSIWKEFCFLSFLFWWIFPNKNFFNFHVYKQKSNNFLQI